MKVTSDDFDDRIKRFLGLGGGTEIYYICEPKMDGRAVELVYENGDLAIGSTRGERRLWAKM